uniref:F-box domain-containing protein n=1 Tax=Echeneis naucrates TaxID=173247 RepID=A0A665U7M2_ECHNA
MVRKASRNVSRYTMTHKSHQYKSSRRPERTIMTRSQRVTSCSFFHRLPAEVFHMVLDKLSLLEISVLSMVSKEITRHIVDYISTLSWKNKMIVQAFHHSTFQERRSTIGHYRNLGLLFKRSTLLLPTKDRLKFIFSRFSQCLIPDCIGFSSYGVFLQTLIAGWDELECQRVFNFLCDITNLLQKMEAMSGSENTFELRTTTGTLRVFCRQVLLDPWSNQPECRFWLMQLLKPWPVVSKAHLLFILYGPLLPDGQPHSALWDLARAILLLFGKLTVKGWSTESLLSMLDELIGIPQPWHVENVARLLVLCGSSLCYTVLASKALNGQLPESSRLIVYIILVCEKDGYHMKWAVNLVQQICKVFSTAPERLCFIRQVENMFSEITREFYEFSVADRETFQTFCILLDSSARFHTKLLHMFLK